MGHTYTQVLKLHNIELENPVQIKDNLWIENSQEYSQPLDPFSRAFYGLRNPQTYFYDELTNSNVIIRSEYKDSDQAWWEPFKNTILTIALAIYCDFYFAAGITYQRVHLPGEKGGHGLETAWITGPNKKNILSKKDEEPLKNFYDFVYQHIDSNSELRSIVFLFLKCISTISIHPPSFLNITLNDMITDRVVNFAILIEAIFTKESRKTIKGIKIWNQHFPKHSIDEDMASVALNKRHILAHSNATDAKKEVLTWQKTNGYNDNQANNAIEQFIQETCRKCLRAIILQPKQYEVFSRNKP